jgi:TPR repeat protein
MRAGNYEWDGYGNWRKKKPSECYEVFLQDKIEKRNEEEGEKITRYNYDSTEDFEEAYKQFLKEVDREWEELQERKKDLEKQNKPTDQSEPITLLGLFKLPYHIVMFLTDFCKAVWGIPVNSPYWDEEKSEEEPEEEKAFKWYMKSAEQGDACAQRNVGYAYNYGEGVEQDEEKAFKWYMKAAEQGDADAQLEVGEAYRYGKGVEQDEEKAFKWWKLAAEQGHEIAKYNLDNYK